MVKRLLWLVPFLAVAGVQAQPAPAIDIPALAAKAATRYPQPVRVGTLLGRDVVKPVESQPVLGHVAAFTRRPDGGLDMVIAFGGVLGIGARPIAVPVEAVALISPYVTVLGFTPAQLAEFPTATVPPAARLGSDDIIDVGLTRPFH